MIKSVTKPQSHEKISIRPSLDEDSAALVAIIGACYALYPGCILDVDAEVPALRAPKRLFAAENRQLWVMLQNGKVVGCGGLCPGDYAGDRAARPEMIKLYLHPSCHGQGLGTRLCAFLIKQASHFEGAERLILWTDSRFHKAHRLYERMGFERQRQTRVLNDLSQTTEYLYFLTLETAHAS